MIVTLYAIAICTTAIAITLQMLVRSGRIDPLMLGLTASVLFVVIGQIILSQSESFSWRAQPALITSTGLLITILAAIVGGWLFLQPTPVNETPNDGTSGQKLNRNEIRARVIASIIILAICALYFVYLGYIPIVDGMKSLLGSGGTITPGLTNTARIDRDVYVNPEAQYIPMQGLLEMFRYFGCSATFIWGIDIFRRNRQYRRIGFMLMAVSAFFVISTGQRWPLMYLIASVLVYMGTTKRLATHTLRKIALITVACGVALSTLLGRTASQITNPLDAVSFGAGSLFQRIFLGYVTIPFDSYGMSTAALTPNGNTWMQNIASYLPGPGASYPVTFYQSVTGSHIGFTAAPDVWTEGWINMGWTGVILSSVLYGAMLVFATRILRSKVKSDADLTRICALCPISVSLAFACFTGVVFVLGSFIVVGLAMMCINTLRAFTRERNS